ncbi:GNAT family N-acetyltransferase [Pikeienuella sp. HZG-20]|uniref:GNAT family N-acetyltransferase n=1 Tax=Paludibacillus litoralis TaxID=3133267 RepID=UPI0030EB559D
MAPRLVRGLPEEHRRAAARLYLEAFAAKLGPVIGRGERAEAYLAATIRPGNALVALDDAGNLLGLAGFRDETGGFLGGGLSEIQRVYGWFGGFWRGLILSIFDREPEPGELMMDGVVVAPAARGRGVGGALIEAVAALAPEQAALYVRLDVANTNSRARALYERRGFVATRESGSPLLKPFFGFSRAVTMLRPVGPV